MSSKNSGLLDLKIENIAVIARNFGGKSLVNVAIANYQGTAIFIVEELMTPGGPKVSFYPVLEGGKFQYRTQGLDRSGFSCDAIKDYVVQTNELGYSEWVETTPF